MQVVLLMASIILAVVILGTGVLIYLVVRLMITLVRSFRISSLPRSVNRSLKEARGYGRAIMEVARQYPPGPMRDRLNLTIQPVGEWLASLAKLERGLEKLYHQRNLPREIRQTTFEIDSLRRQMLMASAKEVASVRMLLESKKQHLAALKELQAFQTQAELKIRKITSDLGTTHAEMLLIVARGDFNENRLHRLDENLQEHLSSMRDMLAAMDEMGYSRAIS
jgi:chorismate-pyruvate lyase